MMNNTPVSKSIKLNIDPILNKEGLSKIEGQAKIIAKEFSNIFSDEKQKKAIEGAFSKTRAEIDKDKTKYEGLLQKREQILELLPYASGEEKKVLKQAEKSLRQEMNQTKTAQKLRTEAVKEGINEIKDKAIDVLKNIATNVKDKMDEIAEYNVSGSIFGTATAREKMLRYGTSEAQTFGLAKTMSTLGLNTEEDLWYMNPNQRAKFAELIGTYTAKYNELANKDFFKSYEEFKLEFAMFKDELYYDLIGIIVDNKDTIMAFLRLGVEAMKGIINFLGTVGKATGYGSRSVGDIISSYSNTTSKTSQSYNFNNTFNMNDTSVSAAQMFGSNIMNVIKQLSQS